MAWYYAIAERDHDIQNPTSREKIRLMGEWLRLGPETRVLDIASGDGAVAEILAPRSRTISCLDRSVTVVQKARRRLEGFSNVIVSEGDMHDLASPDASFDTVLLLASLSFTDRPEQVLDEVAALLRVEDGAEPRLRVVERLDGHHDAGPPHASTAASTSPASRAREASSVMIASVTTGRSPRASMPPASAESTPSSTNVSTRSA